MSIRSQYAYLQPQPQVWIFILASAGVHLLLVVTLIVGGWLKEKGNTSREATKITALLRKGVEKNKDWLPDKLPAPQKAQPKEIRSTNSDSSKKDYRKDMSRALQGLTQEGGRTSTAEEQQGSPDGVEEGDSLIAQKGNEYVTKLYKAIKAQYSVPELISQRERTFLTATVVITVDSRGNIKDLEFEKQSGNSFFDSAVESAIRKAAPFPPPPSELADKYASEGIGLEFRP